MEKNINILKTLFNDVFTKGNVDRLNDLLAEDVILHEAGLRQDVRGLKNFREMENTYKTAFPDKKATIVDCFAANDKVIVHWTCKGTHKGTFHGLNATNRPFDIRGISIYTISNGKIVDICQSWDKLGLFEQLGEVQRPAALTR